MFRVIAIALASLSSFALSAQGLLDQPVEVDENKDLSAFIQTVENQNPGVRFFYAEEWISSVIIKKQFSGFSLKKILESALEHTDVQVLFLYDYAIIFVKDPKKELARDSIIAHARRRNVDVGRLKFGSKNLAGAGNVTVTGKVTDKRNDRNLPDVLIEIGELGKRLRTSVNGDFQLEIPPGEYVLSFQLFNFEEQMVHADIYEDAHIDIQLEEMPLMLEEVVISDESIINRNVGQASIKMTDLKRTPSFLGQADIIKNLQLQTGVSAVSEVSPGFNVRGGGADQNLVLYDGVPIFNTSHALGFFSAFNPEAIKDVAFYKGGIPAEFGGRVSSVLNIMSKEGNYNRWIGNVGASFVAADVAADGPVVKDRSSLSLSLRSTYSDWILNLLENSYKDVQNSAISFYDGAAKYTEKLSNGAKITLSGYVSHDRFQLATDSVNRWQNIAGAIRYDNTLNSQVTYSLTANIGQYSFGLSEADPATAFNLRYKILYPSLKFDVNREGKFSQAFGIHVTWYDFRPGNLRPESSESNSKTIEMPSEKSLESAIYFSNQFRFGAKITADVGARLSLFNRFGPGVVYHYAPDGPMEPRNMIDSISFASGQMMKTYSGFEPRVAVKYQLSPQSSLKLGYNRILQYVHLISNTATITPVDIWQSSDPYFKPQIADQVSLGYFVTGKSGIWQTLVEVFYKNTDNILDFKDGANLILNRQLETALLAGSARSYGVEFAIIKSKTRLEFELNYTYSRSLRKVNGFYATEKVNNGEWYPSNYDQPHIANINWRYALGKKVFFTGTFSYRTGRPISFPEMAYEINEVPIIGFSERNNYRLPDYHRLDIALVVEGSNKREKRIRGQWSLSIYNLYGRKNPYSAFFSYNVAGAVKPYQISLIGVPVPSLSYRIKF